MTSNSQMIYPSDTREDLNIRGLNFISKLKKKMCKIIMRETKKKVKS